MVRALAAEVGVEIPEARRGGRRRGAPPRARSATRCSPRAMRPRATWRPASRAATATAARRYLEGRGIAEEAVRRFRLGVAADGLERPRPARSRRRASQPRRSCSAGLARRRRRAAAPTTASATGSCSRSPAIDGAGDRVRRPRDAGRRPRRLARSTSTRRRRRSTRSRRCSTGSTSRARPIRKTRAARCSSRATSTSIGLHQAGVANAVAVCGTALTPEHVELLQRCDCREVTVLFDGDVAGLAAPGEGRGGALPRGRRGQGRDPAGGRAGRPIPTSTRARTARAGGRGAPRRGDRRSRSTSSSGAVARPLRRAPRARRPLEAKLAAVRELRPFVRLMPEGLARSRLRGRGSRSGSTSISRRSVAELERRAAEPRAPPPAPAPAAVPAPTGPPVRAAPRRRRGDVRAPAGPGGRRPRAARRVPRQLAAIAEEENLPALLPAGPLADLARDLVARRRAARGRRSRASRRAPTTHARRSPRELAGARAGRRAERAERELRKAAVKARDRAARGGARTGSTRARRARGRAVPDGPRSWTARRRRAGCGDLRQRARCEALERGRMKRALRSILSRFGRARPPGRR